MDLSGTWSFQLDPLDEGLAGQWYAGPLAQQIHLPGSLQAQGFGQDVTLDAPWTGDIIDRSYFTDPRYAPYREPGNIKVPFWLQPEKVYAGPAWYQRLVDIPPEWPGRRMTLFLERPHWQTRLWVDGQEIGTQDSLSTPHIYDLGTRLAPGPHTLTLRVDNRMLINVGPNSHSMTDHTQTNWNGIVGQIELKDSSPIWVEDIQVFPDLERQVFNLRIHLGSALDQPVQAVLTLTARGYNSDTPHVPLTSTVEVALPPGETIVEAEYTLGSEAQAWDEFQPALYRMIATLEGEPSVEPSSGQAAAAQASEPVTETTPGESTPVPAFYDFKEVITGLREVTVQGTQIALNGRLTFLRGTLESCIFPLTGYPPTDVEAWKRIMGVARQYGLNHLRFHSWCPPEAAFVAADEEGIYLSVECASWANQGASIGEGSPLDEWLYQEGHRITTFYGNHPSFLLMAYGNEPAGKINEYLTDWVQYWRMRDNRRLYTSGAGWPEIPANDYHNTPRPRIHQWGDGLNSRINGQPPETMTDYSDFVRDAGKPIVSHEIGQWCAYPNFDEIAKYTGHIKARNFEIFRDFLNQAGMGSQARDFLMASGRLQVLCYKEEIESALRTPGFAGFHLLDLHDFPGQGTALVGVLDPFWDDKGYVTGPEYSRFCNAVVPLARMAKRTWLNSETFHCEVDAANFGPAPLSGVTPAWKLIRLAGADEEEEAVVAWGALPEQDIPLGNGSGDSPLRLGSIDIPLHELLAPARCRLEVLLPEVVNPNHQSASNSWDFWVYPDSVDIDYPAGIEVTTALDPQALEHLSRGGSVLVLLPPARVKTDAVLGFSTVFWNTAWTRNQPPHTLGLLVDPQHPLFAHFPTSSHTDWQWWDLVHGAEAMQLDELPAGLRPVIQPIDTWFSARRLGLLFEARINGGRVIVCSMDLKTNLDARHAARQLRHSLLRYMTGPDFAPQVELRPEDLQKLVT